MRFMAAPLIFLLTKLRGRWRGWLALALLAGLFAGAVDAVAAAMILALAVSAVPGEAAARTRPAGIPRSE
jgi:hypothetical protein